VCRVLDLPFHGWLLPLMQAVSLGLVLSAVAGIAPVLMGQMGAGARAALRAEGLSSRREARRPVRAAASSSPAHGLLCAVAPELALRRLARHTSAAQ
jgi:hypothetical protein